MTEPDPILAAIAAYRAAWEALERNCSRLDAEGTPQADAELDRLHDAACKAEQQLVAVMPTTMAGITALARHVAEFAADRADDLGGFPPRYIYRTIASALERLA